MRRSAPCPSEGIPAIGAAILRQNMYSISLPSLDRRTVDSCRQLRPVRLGPEGVAPGFSPAAFQIQQAGNFRCRTGGRSFMGYHRRP